MIHQERNRHTSSIEGPGAPTAEKILEDLLVDLFEDNDEVRRFLESNTTTQAISKAVPSVNVSRHSYCSATTRSLWSHGLVSSVLLTQLALYRPAQVGRISHAAACLSIVWAEPHNAIRPRTKPRQRLHSVNAVAVAVLLATSGAVGFATAEFGTIDPGSSYKGPSGFSPPEVEVWVPERTGPFAPEIVLKSDEHVPLPAKPESSFQKQPRPRRPTDVSETSYTESVPKTKQRQIPLKVISKVNGLMFDTAVPEHQDCENTARTLFLSSIMGKDDAATRERFKGDTFELCQARCCREQSVGTSLSPSSPAQIRRNGSFMNQPEASGLSPPKNRALPQ